MTSWVGISITWMRRSTRTISWMNGISSTRPGPLTAWNLPSVKTTARSYWRNILTAHENGQQDEEGDWQHKHEQHGHRSVLHCVCNAGLSL
jgi:hypothetical protein